MRKRKVFVRFPTKHGSSPSLLSNLKSIDGVNIKFAVSIYSQAGLPAETIIEVYNLNRKDLEFLTTSASTWLDRSALIQLWAGYDDNVRMLFSGQILEAPPNGNPDVALTIKGLSDMQWFTENIQVNMSETTLLGLINKASEAMGYVVNIPEETRNQNVWLNTRIENFSYTGTPMGLMAKIQAMCGGFAVDKRAFVLSVYNNEVFLWDGVVPRGRKKLLVSKKTGMVGYPHPTGVGVNIKMLLNPTVKCGDIIQLKSDRVPICNGDYFVTAIKHEGELRGGRFYTTLECSHAKHFG